MTKNSELKYPVKSDRMSLLEKLPKFVNMTQTPSVTGACKLHEECKGRNRLPMPSLDQQSERRSGANNLFDP